MGPPAGTSARVDVGLDGTASEAELVALGDVLRNTTLTYYVDDAAFTYYTDNASLRGAFGGLQLGISQGWHTFYWPRSAFHPRLIGADIDVDAANAHPLLGLGRDTDRDPADGGDDTDDDLPDLEEAGGAEDWGG